MSLFEKKVEDTIVVEGMKCVHCKQRVEDTLKKLGVKALVNLETKEVKVEYKQSAISLEKIKEEINNLGFKA